MATLGEIVGAIAVLVVTATYGWCAYCVDQDKYIREAEEIATEARKECLMHFYKTYTVD